ncbi:MAG: ATP synthase F1 subunit gamma [bacterium]|nr:ATP synthase F1 subunit gamma [bacterium]
MPSIRDIKRRMRSVANTGKITRAMEAVSATKMRKAQAVAFAARPYAVHALKLLQKLSGASSVSHWLLEERPRKKIAIMLVTSDKGLCGVLNANVIRKFEKILPELVEGHSDHSATPPDIITIGRFGAKYITRHIGKPIKEFEGIGDIVGIEESRPVSRFLLHAYQFKHYDAVYAVYANFISVLKQESVMRQLLPLTKERLREMAMGIVLRSAKEDSATGTKYQYEYKLEPNPNEILDLLLPALVEAEAYHVLLEANASEHSARMIAMKNASDNAKDLLEALQLSYNKVRQAGITREIAEITGGAAALES